MLEVTLRRRHASGRQTDQRPRSPDMALRRPARSKDRPFKIRIPTVLTIDASALQSKRNKSHDVYNPRGDCVLMYRYTAVFEPAAEGGYIVSVPALPGLVTEGDTIEEARAMVKDAIRGYLESLLKHGEEIPIESGTANVERVEINI